MLRHVVAGPAEVEDFVPRTEEFLEQIREAVALLDALSPRERVADHGDAVAVGRFGRNLAIAEAEAVGSVRRTAGAAGDEIAGAAARLRATELKACEELGGDEGSRRHGDDQDDAEQDAAGSTGHARRRASVGPPFPGSAAAAPGWFRRIGTSATFTPRSNASAAGLTCGFTMTTIDGFGVAAGS